MSAHFDGSSLQYKRIPKAGHRANDSMRVKLLILFWLEFNFLEIVQGLICTGAALDLHIFYSVWRLNHSPPTPLLSPHPPTYSQVAQHQAAGPEHCRVARKAPGDDAAYRGGDRPHLPGQHSQLLQRLFRLKLNLSFPMFLVGCCIQDKAVTIGTRTHSHTQYISINKWRPSCTQTVLCCLLNTVLLHHAGSAAAPPRATLYGGRGCSKRSKRSRRSTTLLALLLVVARFLLQPISEFFESLGLVLF